tara:strand:- start:198 stop:458 length:261 start_codon:yes stop_codon:yes gene_type:complete
MELLNGKNRESKDGKHFVDLDRQGEKKAAILVIDNEETIRESLQEILIMAGHEVTSAGSGRKGFDYFEKGGYDLLITDLCMAEMNG